MSTLFILDFFVCLFFWTPSFLKPLAHISRATNRRRIKPPPSDPPIRQRALRASQKPTTRQATAPCSAPSLAKLLVEAKLPPPTRWRSARLLLHDNQVRDNYRPSAAWLELVILDALVMKIVQRWKYNILMESIQMSEGSFVFSAIWFWQFLDPVFESWCPDQKRKYPISPI